MKEIYRTADMVKLTALQSLLRQAGLVVYVTGEHSGAVLPGIAHTEPRILVDEQDYDAAIKLIEDAHFEL